MSGASKKVSKVAGVFGLAVTPVVAVAAILALILVVVGSGVFVAYKFVLDEPNARAWEKRANATLKHVLPLPKPLLVVDRQEDCGNGQDPICGSVDFLVRSEDSSEAPVDELAQLLESRGWRLTRAKTGTVSGVRGSARVEVTPLDVYVQQNQPVGLFLEGFLADHSSKGVAFLTVMP